jgi:tetratricopeptide (TPR) repeat protein
LQLLRQLVVHPSRIFTTATLLLLGAAACGQRPAEQLPAASSSPAAAASNVPTTESVKPKSDRKPGVKTPKVEPTFEAQIAALDRRIAGHTKVAEGNPSSATAWGRVAELYLARARLSGNYDDYAKAEELVNQGFEAGKLQEYGPYMTRARLNYTLHRLDRVDADFAKINLLPAQDKGERYSRDLFRANLAFQRGQYAEAERLLLALVDFSPNIGSLSNLALFRWKSGKFDEAESLYARAIAEFEGDEAEPLAWLHLQLGLMDLDRGRWDDALAHYRDAEKALSGFWLVEEHIAEILTLKGETDAAKTMYSAIIDRTGNPEFMDAMAEIAQAQGDQAAADEWISQANEKFEAQLARFPEAAYGHALEHFLAFGKDPAKTLEMAEKNHALRPNADAKRFLAEAYLAAGRVDDAKRTIEEALATPMRSADLHATAAAVYEAAGDKARATEQRALAVAINPKTEI